MKRFQSGCFGLLLGVVALAGCRQEPRLEPPPEYAQVRDDLLAVGEFRHYPAIDPTGRWMIFARNNLAGVEYGMLDLTTRSVVNVVTNARGDYQNVVAELYAWSPDGRWLAWVEPAGMGKASTVKVRDMASGTIEDAGVKQEFQDLLWLDANTLAVRGGDTLVLVERAEGRWRPDYRKRFHLTAEANKESNPANTNALKPRGIDWKTLTRFESNQLAYACGGNLWRIECQTGKATRLTDWDLGVIKWLDYSAARQAFLFSAANPADVNQLSLMAWSRTNEAIARPLPLTEPGVNALKGRWLPKGYAYVADDPDHSHLVEVADDGSVRTFFAEGSLWSYEVGAGGAAFGAIASANMEPLGLWKVNASTGEKEQLLAGDASPPVVERRLVTNGSGQSFEYTVFRSSGTHLTSNSPVLCFPAYGRFWSELSRVLPRLGIIEVMLGSERNTIGNFRAQEWKSLGSVRQQDQQDRENLRTVMQQAQETLRQVMQQVGRDHPVDTNRFYLAGISQSTSALERIIETSPGVFRGVILDNPVAGGLIDVSLLKREGLELLITIGTEDGNYDQTKKYVAAARQQGVRVWLVEMPGMGHTVGNSEELEQRIRATVSFIHRSAPAEP